MLRLFGGTALRASLVWRNRGAECPSSPFAASPDGNSLTLLGAPSHRLPVCIHRRSSTSAAAPSTLPRSSPSLPGAATSPSCPPSWASATSLPPPPPTTACLECTGLWPPTTPSTSPTSCWCGPGHQRPLLSLLAPSKVFPGVLHVLLHRNARVRFEMSAQETSARVHQKRAPALPEVYITLYGDTRTQELPECTRQGYTSYQSTPHRVARVTRVYQTELQELPECIRQGCKSYQSASDKIARATRVHHIGLQELPECTR